MIRIQRVSLSIIMLLGAVGAVAGSEKPPNVVIILADDMGYGDLSCYGATRIATPHLDRLAADGRRFTDAHAPGAVCVPSRYGLMTGRYPFRVANMSTRNGPVIEDGRMTIASLLQDNGYTTAMIGKWHLGFDGGNDFDYAQPLRGGPTDRGFDSFFGIPASTDIPPYFYIRNDRVVTAPSVPIEENYSPGWTRRPVQGAFWRAGVIAPDMKLEEVMPAFTREAISWIERHGKAGSSNPFFLYVAFSAPHTPWLPEPRFRGRSGASLYGDFVMQVDDSVGAILKSLSRAGFEKDTLVIFSSDNGPVWLPTDRVRFGHSSAGIYRGMKGDAWEGGHRVPFIARWPGRITPGKVNPETISLVDLLATFAALVAKELPEKAGEDSFNLMPLLLESDSRFSREATIALSSGGTPTIRQGDWKLIPELGSRGLSEPRALEPEPNGPTGQLYNLGTDPSEARNIWQEHPEVVARLTTLLQTYQQRGRSRPID